MLTVSETATEELRKGLDEVPAGVAYRLLVSDDGYDLRLDRPSERDRIIESEDRMVLMLAPGIDQESAGLVLDVNYLKGVKGEDKLSLRLVPAVNMS